MGTGSHQGRALSYCVLGLHVGASIYFSEQWSCNFCPLVMVNMAPGGHPWEALPHPWWKRMQEVGIGLRGSWQASPHTPRSLCDPEHHTRKQRRNHSNVGIAEVEAPH